MTRYFKQYIDSTRDIEIDKARAIAHLGMKYQHPARVLKALPLGYIIRVGWCDYRKVKTK